MFGDLLRTILKIPFFKIRAWFFKIRYARFLKTRQKVCQNVRTLVNLPPFLIFWFQCLKILFRFLKIWSWFLKIRTMYSFLVFENWVLILKTRMYFFLIFKNLFQIFKNRHPIFKNPNIVQIFKNLFPIFKNTTYVLFFHFQKSVPDF